MPLKLHHAVLTGVVGLACLLPVAINKPLFVFVTRCVPENTAYTGHIEGTLANPQFIRRLTRATIIHVLAIACIAGGMFLTFR